MGIFAKFGIALVAFLWGPASYSCGQQPRRISGTPEGVFRSSAPPGRDFRPAAIPERDRTYSGIPGRDLRLSSYLYEAGSRVDCYYTIEDLLEGERQPNIILCSRSIPYSDPGRDVRKVVKHLNDHLTGYVAMQNKTNSQIVHIIDKRLLRSPKYVMDSRVSIDFRGRLPLLAEKIGETAGGRMHIRRRGIICGLEAMTVDRTEVRVLGKNQRVRDLLTNYVPLSQYCRFIWVAEVYPSPKGLTAAIQYEGPLWLPKHGDWWRADQPIPFSLGHPAYVHNSEEHIPAAIAYLKTEMTAKAPTQVRWAMFFLGKHKRKEGIPILLEYLDYRYTACQILEESYPAVNALLAMGTLASAPIAQALPNESSNLRRRLLCYSLLCINGATKGREIIQAILTDMKDKEQKKSIQVALTQAQILFNYSPINPSEDTSSR